MEINHLMSGCSPRVTILDGFQQQMHIATRDESRLNSSDDSDVLSYLEGVHAALQLAKHSAPLDLEEHFFACLCYNIHITRGMDSVTRRRVYQRCPNSETPEDFECWRNGKRGTNFDVDGGLGILGLELNVTMLG